MSRYEEMAQAQFETYAVQRIRGAMLDELRNNDWLPRSTRQNMKKIEQAIASLQQLLVRPPIESEIATKLNMPLNEYQQMLGESAGHQLIYFEDFHASGDEGGDLGGAASDRLRRVRPKKQGGRDSGHLREAVCPSGVFACALYCAHITQYHPDHPERYHRARFDLGWSLAQVQQREFEDPVPAVHRTEGL